MTYYELILECPRERLEELEAVLPLYGKNGWDVSDSLTRKDLDERVLKWTAVMDASLLPEKKDKVQVKLYFEDPKEGKLAMEALGKQGYAALSFEALEEEDYAHNWKKFYHSLEVGEFLVVPAWEMPPETEKTLLRINPGMAFGSGTHETTMLCLELMEGISLEGFGYDVGCGSGILGIGALLQGADRVRFLDIDPLALSATRENGELNALTSRMEVASGDLLKGEIRPASFIFANLIGELVVQMIPDSAGLLLPGGYLIASGILKKTEPMVSDALTAHGFEIERRKERGEWIGLAARRREYV